MVHPPPVIAIMGAKGGVGKTTLACRMAELIAEKGNDVMLVDLDVESAGSTTLHRRRARRGAGPGVATVYDHLKHLHRKAGADDSQAGVNRINRGGDTDEMGIDEDPALDPPEDVTPAYLDRRGLGRIYILPARPFSQVADRWESVANLPPEIRNELLLGELKRMMDRGSRAPLQKRVDCIIFDS
jgi:cellulose biosynthesis protein BcsQ